ncbi:alpha/beta hydrolase [Actinosynnema sp. ALI-1.44]|uniref:proline iminopeptidase-family hydrolase n=1 Tax=Actinosynnema sp. ALI-1.44 TaxID=1933779 RepID=UPI00097C646E|nr:proline iminopeptidase-family hydrolase [Actinosynnema sp. ALI-1.44]ONI83227.1 alpha/beta hydrolase [Actinosynnema sp. ALI-1.44]
MNAPVKSGKLPFGQYETWYRVTGDLGSGKPPLVVLHGGPGNTHDYLLRLAELAGHGWPVVHYDQLGNGGSTHLPHHRKDFWTPQLFLDELDNLLDGLGVIEDYVLFGQSWGGMLGAAHAATQPAGLRGLVIANSPASMVTWRAETALLRAELPAEVQAVLSRHEAAGTTDSKEYFEATMAFYNRHLCRVQPWPKEVRASFMEMFDDPTVYSTMNGPNEFHVIGTLKDFSVVDQLPDITVPTLVITGRHDEATPATARPFADEIKGARWEVLPESSHMPHVEQPELFDSLMLEFLAEIA